MLKLIVSSVFEMIASYVLLNSTIEKPEDIKQSELVTIIDDFLMIFYDQRILYDYQIYTDVFSNDELKLYLQNSDYQEMQGPVLDTLIKFMKKRNYGKF